MASVVELLRLCKSRPFVACDFSPPRGGTSDLMSEALSLTPDMFLVAYSPGKSVRTNPVAAAHWISKNTGREAAFMLATRDMNKNALQSILLGAQLLGLDNIVSVMGDKFETSERKIQKSVYDFSSTEFIESIKEMNNRLDFKKRVLRNPTQFCVGGAIDLSREWGSEISLTEKKVNAGADFFISQPSFDALRPRNFLEQYREYTGVSLGRPVLWGIQMMVRDSISFAAVPDSLQKDLDLGRSGFEIALETIQIHRENGFESFYLVPPVFKGGRRDYESAQALLDELGVL